MAIDPASLLEDLGRNIALVLGLMFTRGLLRGLDRGPSERLRTGLSGLLFGLAAVAAMTVPVRLAPGVIMDMRNVLVALSYCFEGPLAGTVAAIIAVGYRLSLGGTGALPGVLLIIAAAGTGALFWRKLSGVRAPSLSELLWIGAMLSAAALSLTLLLALEMTFDSVLALSRRVLVTVTLGYPIGTALVGTLLSYESRRVEAERALEHERDLLARVASTSPAGIVTVDRAGVIIMANAQAERVLGRRVSDIVGRRHDALEWALTDYEGRPIEKAALPFAKVSQSREAVRGIRLAVQTGGTRTFLSVNAAPMSDPRGGFAGMVATIEDVTESVLAERRLHESEEKFRTLFDRASDAIFVQPVSADGRASFLEVNEVACRWLGRTRAELLHRTFADIDAGHSGEELVALLSVTPERPLTFETKLRDAQGQTRDVEVVAQWTALMGQPVVMALARDLSERRKLERQVLEGQKLEVVGRLAGGIAHDFNNVLAIIMFSSEIMQRSEDLTLIRDLAREVAETAERGASLTRQLLTFSRKQTVVPSTTRFDEGVSHMLKLVRRIIPANIEVHTHLNDDSSVRIDIAQLEQVLLNLVVNARDAMPNGGRLELRSSRRVLDAAQTLGRPGLKPGPHVVFEVTDTGCGMTDDVLQHIFEPFFTTKQAHGTGLGLAICFNIIQQAAGHIEVESAHAQGTTFRLYLPCVPNMEKRLTVANGPTKVGRERILLVEDEVPLRSLVRAFLQASGYEVYDAGNADEALMALPVGSPPDLLVTDVMLPGMSGPELFDQLRTIIPRLKVVYTSGYPADALLRYPLNRDQVHLVHKPFTSDVLAQAVRAALDDQNALL